MKKRITAMICMLAMLFSLCTTSVLADNAGDSVWSNIFVYGDASAQNTKIHMQDINGNAYLFLPSNISPKAVTFGYDGAYTYKLTGDKNVAVDLRDSSTVDLTALCSGDSSYKLSLEAKSGSKTVGSLNLTVICSANTAAMYLVSSDPVNKGRTWVEASPDKSNKADGSMVMQSADGTFVYDGALTQIKGRGNSTWRGLKRPYQIKLDKKTDLLESGVKSNSAKTWVLLANYADPSLLRNTIALDLGYEMGMDPAMENRAVDLYYDGEYRGSYLLTEKVQINKGRVNITDLEELNASANPGVDLESLPVATDKTANGATYKYCKGMQSPADYSGGYLLEMETAARTAAEVCFFHTTRNNYVVVKSPEFASKEEMNYIATMYQEYEDALYSENGVNTATGKSYSDYVDLKTTAQCYLINELSKNIDGFRTSAYLYKDANENQLKMGPLWDYDLSFGVGSGTPQNAAEQRKATDYYTARSLFAGRLYTMPDFRLAVKNEYQNTVYPLISNVLLGDTNAVGANGKLHSLSWYRNELLSTATADFIMWRPSSSPAGDWSNQISYLENYIRVRSNWLNERFTTWNADSYDPIGLYLDVSSDSWYFEYVQKATGYGLMHGTSSNMFDPQRQTTRAQVVRVLFNMSGAEICDFEKIFSDVTEDQWCAIPITWGAHEKVIAGFTDGTFRPNDSITRQDLVVLLYRYVGSPSVSGNQISKFSDASKIGAYAADAMEWAVENDIISGYLDDTVQPKGLTTRAQLAKIICVFYENFIMSA